MNPHSLSETDQILDHILVPRSNGSEGLEQVGAYLKSFLADAGAQVSAQPFTATPYGFQLVWAAVLCLMLLYMFCVYQQRYGWALLLCTLTPVLLVAEFEFLQSPISGLWPHTQQNIIATYPAINSNDTLMIVAHYDTATHFGDHFSWGFWGKMQGPAQALAYLLVIYGMFCKKTSRVFPVLYRLGAAVLVLVPFTAMFFFQSLGPLLRTPSIGAIDNGGSMAAMLLLANKLHARNESTAWHDVSQPAIKLVFVSAEEERTLGSWAYAQHVLQNENIANIKVINLESVGASDELAYIAEDGFATRRYRSPEAMIAYVNQAAEQYFGQPLPERSLPFGTLTDGRSFLAHGIQAITLRSFDGEQFPRRLHSEYDSRDRLSVRGIEQTADFLFSLAQGTAHN